MTTPAEQTAQELLPCISRCDWPSDNHDRDCPAYYVAKVSAALQAKDDEIERLRKALVEAAIPMEAMILSGTIASVSEPLRDGILHAVGKIRAALSPKDQGEKV